MLDQREFETARVVTSHRDHPKSGCACAASRLRIWNTGINFTGPRRYCFIATKCTRKPYWLFRELRCRRFPFRTPLTSHSYAHANEKVK